MKCELQAMLLEEASAVGGEPLREPRYAKTLGSLEWGETPQTPPLHETRYAKTLNSPFRMVIFDTQSPRCARGLDKSNEHI